MSGGLERTVIDFKTPVSGALFCFELFPEKQCPREPDCNFVYDRRYGFFTVGMGYHQAFMATILTLENPRLKKKNMPQLADLYMSSEGVAFKSSASDCVYYSELTEKEMHMLEEFKLEKW